MFRSQSLSNELCARRVALSSPCLPVCAHLVASSEPVIPRLERATQCAIGLSAAVVHLLTLTLARSSRQSCKWSESGLASEAYEPIGASERLLSRA